MIGGEGLEPGDCRIERKRAREVERRVEQRAVGGHDVFGDCYPMKCGAGVNAKSDGNVDGVTALESPPRETERLFDGPWCFPRASNQEDPESPEPVLLHALRDFADFCRGESLLQLFQNRIARAFGGNAERAESCR